MTTIHHTTVPSLVGCAGDRTPRSGAVEAVGRHTATSDQVPITRPAAHRSTRPAASRKHLSTMPVHPRPKRTPSVSSSHDKPPSGRGANAHLPTRARPQVTTRPAMSSSGSGYWGSSSSRWWRRIRATARLRAHLRSAGTTYHGASSVDVLRKASRNAAM